MRRVLAPRWWLLHVVVLLIAAGMLRLGLWQWHRAESSNGGIQNYAYAFQWPLFATFGIVLWLRTLVLEVRRPAGSADAQSRPAAPAPAPGTSATVIRQPGVRVGLTTPTTVVEDDDPEVAARNAALAALNAADAAVQSRRR